jgi:hypothetical protein
VIDNPGICEKQAARVETLLRLSEDEQWVLIKTRKFYKEWAAEWCNNPQPTWNWLVREEWALPIPRILFERTKVVEIVKEIDRWHEAPPCPPVVQQCMTPVVVVPWNGWYHSQPGSASYQTLLNAWKASAIRCGLNPSQWCVGDRPPPPPDGLGGAIGTPPNNPENRRRKGG